MHSTSSRTRAARSALWILIALLLVLPAAVAAAQTAPSTPTRLLASEAAVTATIRLDGATLDEGLVFLYEPGAQPPAPPSSVVGALVDGDRAVVLRVDSCPDLDLPPELAAVCLAVAGLPDEPGTLQGKATLFPAMPAAAGSDAPGTPAQSVDITVTLRRHWTLFAFVALAGTLISLLATWWATEYQQVRRLRAACAGLTANPAVCAGSREAAPGSKLALGPPVRTACDALPGDFSGGVKLWVRSLRGDRPDYAAIQKEIAAAGDARTAFAELCRAQAALLADRQAVSSAFDSLGGGPDEPLLAQRLAKTANPDPPVVAPEQVEPMLAGWLALHTLAGQWLGLAGHLNRLCAWASELEIDVCDRPRPADSLPADPAQLLPDVLEQLEQREATPRPLPGSALARRAAGHLATARSKLAAVETAADLETLDPAADLRAAWLALTEFQQQQTPRTSVEGMAFMAGLEPKEGLEALEAAPLWERLGEWVRSVVGAWSPALNTAVIWLLVGLSLATTIFAGAQLLYIGQPWGTWVDVLFLLAIGTGVHAGLTGLAGTIATRKE